MTTADPRQARQTSPTAERPGHAPRPPTTLESQRGPGSPPSPRLASAGWILGLAFGCVANAPLDAQIARSTRSLAEVEARGALRCAPRELAISRSHLDFARLERAQGFPGRARQHLEVANENLEAARVLTPADRCAAGATPAAEAPPRLAPEAARLPLD